MITPLRLWVSDTGIKGLEWRAQLITLLGVTGIKGLEWRAQLIADPLIPVSPRAVTLGSADSVKKHWCALILEHVR